jgi:undecaprenyl-diphosphatase
MHSQAPFLDGILTGRNALVFVSLLTAWRLYLSAELQLHPDEAYYWLWSRYLDVGYFDHPPLVAYFIWLTTLFSKSELWVRFSGTIVSLLVSGLVWHLSKRLFKSEKVAAGSVALFNVYPQTVLGLIVITPDIPVLLFWAASISIFWRIVSTGQAWLWVAMGFTFGLALLSKYTAILMVPCVLIYLLLTDDRRWLRTLYPYLALAIGLLCFLPVVIWNSRHEWVSFAFQLRNGLGGEGYSPEKVAEYIGGQLLVTGPVVWFLGMYAGFVGIYRRDKETALLLCAALPVILFFGLSSLNKVAGPNWPAFAYFTFCILVTQFCLTGYSRVRRLLWLAAFASSLLLSMAVTLHARFRLIPLEHYSKEIAAADATNAFHGWRELGAALKNYAGRDFAVTPSHQLSAEIIYYTDTKVAAQTALITRPSQFNMWRLPKDMGRTDGLYIWSADDYIGPQGHAFASKAKSDSLHVYRDGLHIRTYHLISGQPGVIPPFYGR